MIGHHKNETTRRRALQVCGEALKCDREALKDNGEDLKAGNEALTGDKNSVKNR